jgi:hypothetical protein
MEIYFPVSMIKKKPALTGSFVKAGSVFYLKKYFSDLYHF